MRVQGGLFFEEGVRSYFSNRRILRTYILLPACLALILLLMWPRASFESALRAGLVTDAFAVVAEIFLLLLLYLGGRYGSEGFSGEAPPPLREYATLTRAALPAVVARRVVVAAVHTVFLLLLGSPFLLASLSVSGVPFRRFLETLAVIGAAGLAARACGLLAVALLGARPFVRDVVLFPGMLLIMGVTFFTAPSVNPFHAVVAVSGAAAPCVLASLGATVALALVVLAILQAARRRARLPKVPDA